MQRPKHATPVIRYAMTADAETDQDEVIVTLAIRDFAECELRIPRDKYRPFELLKLIEEHGRTIRFLTENASP